jgi:eukaryotic-like serine/threonine-protein kinase
MSTQPGGPGAGGTGFGGDNDEPLSPTVFNGRYELQRHLARGGMADVYLATDKLLNRSVAVKVLFPEYARDETFVERFRREAQAAAGLTHGNIVAIYDWGEEFGTYFIVMEFVEGQSLSELIRADGPLEARQAAQITAKVASALDFAHRNGVVHRDVKPGNIMISPVGEVKVADFGIAQALTAGDRSSLTQTGAVMGTATYFSPEQAQGRAVDRRSDLYSLGCVLFEMLTATPPFTGDSPVSIAYKHVQEPVPTMVSRGVTVPADLEAIDATLLNKDPDHRYDTAADLEGDLQRFLDGQRVRDTMMVAGPGVGAVAGGAMVMGAGGPPGPGTAPPRGRAGRGWAVALMVLGLLVLGLGLFLVGSNLSNDQPTQVVVPRVVGLPVAEAEAVLLDVDLVVVVVREVNQSVPEGVVFSQDPGDGARVALRTIVELRVSAGLGDAEVPNVVGRTEAEAVRLLVAADFESRTESRPDDTVPEGRVIITNPPAGARIPKGSEVVLVVSTGVDEVTVPNLIGQTELAASNQLGRLDLQTGIERVFSPSEPEGVVVATRPAPGTRVKPGETVVLVVSRGPEPVPTTAPPPPPTAPTTTTTSVSPTVAPVRPNSANPGP